MSTVKCNNCGHLHECSKVRQISYAQSYGVPSVTIEYPTVSPWNADGSLFLLIHHDHFAIHNGSTYVPLSIPASGEPRWHPEDPDWLLSLDGNRVLAFNARYEKSFVLHKFKEYESISSKGEADFSEDGDHLILVGANPDSFYREVFLFNHRTKKKTMLAQLDEPFDSVMLTPSNKALVSKNDGIYIYPDARRITPANGHKDITSINGVEYLIWINSNDPSPAHNNTVMKVNVATGEQIPLLSFPWQIAVNISCAEDSALISTYQAPDAAIHELSNKLILLDIATGRFWADQPHNSIARDYTSQPRGVLSPRGDILFNSNQGGEIVNVYATTA